MNDENEYSDPAPKWWKAAMVFTVLALAAGMLLLSGCADPPKPPPPEAQITAQMCSSDCRQVYVSQANADAAQPRARMSEMAVVAKSLADALTSRAAVDAMAACVGACGAPAVAFEASQQQHDRSSAKIVQHTGELLKIPLSIAAGGWAAARIADSGGTTSVENTTNGDGNTSAGRNIADDHSQPIDVTAATIGGGGDGDGSDGPVTLPQ